jgi:dipeptidyl aminopeptidase/acylaminoacyl peptidase
MLVQATNAQGFVQLATLDLANGHVEWVGPSDWDIESVDVADDGTTVFSRNVRGESEVMLAPHANFGALRQIARGGLVIDVTIDRSAHHVALLQEASNHPPSVTVVDLRNGESRERVAPVVANVDLANLTHAERRTFRTFDGRDIDAFLWRPPVARLGTPPPLVVHVHGGPNDQTRGAFSPTNQLLAESGFVVVSVNYRGSTGYGRAFEDLNNHDWGGGDLRDIVTVVGILGTEGVIDSHRVGIYGGSYGGYMTLRAITAAPDVWRAGVEMFGMPDLVEDYRLTADRFATWYHTEMGDPEHDLALFRDRSPIHRLDHVRAALLVLQGENDTNVPRSESDLVVHALRDRHAAVSYVVYPDEGHGFTHREHRLDAMRHTADFFREHLGEPAR